MGTTSSNCLSPNQGALCSQDLSYFNTDSATPMILQCDASQTGLGAWIDKKITVVERILP